MINSNFSLTFQLVRPHQAGGMKAREMLDWEVVEETCIHQSILCVLHSKGSCISRSQVVVVMGSVTFSLGGHQAESVCSWNKENCQGHDGDLTGEPQEQDMTQRMSGRSITKHIQNNISGGKRRETVTVIENVLQEPLWRNSRSRWTLWAKKKIPACSSVRTPYIWSQWSQ